LGWHVVWRLPNRQRDVAELAYPLPGFKWLRLLWHRRGESRNGAPLNVEPRRMNIAMEPKKGRSQNAMLMKELLVAKP